jgi:hypothetical protein
MNLVDAVRATVTLRKVGHAFKGLCPFHGEKTPSFTVNPSRQRFHCFGCGADGDLIDWLMRTERLTFRDAAARAGRDIASEPMADTPAVPVVDPRPLLSALWELVELAPWSSEATAYLQGRGVEPDAAYIVGCRDWSTKMDSILDLIGSFPGEVIDAAGLGQEGRLWAPLRFSTAGIAVPVWRMGEAFPWRWRWRAYAPREGSPKSLSSFGNGAYTDFLGAGLPSLEDYGRTVAEHAFDVRHPTGSTLVIVEGEPDWWSAVEALDGRAQVMAVCGAPPRWRNAWPSIASLKARGVEHIVACFHRGAPQPDGLGHGERLAEDLADHCEAAGVTLRAALPHEGNDLNDMHKRGHLRAWLLGVLQ